MSEYSHTKILAFTGLGGSGKTTAVDYLSAKGIPKISLDTADQLGDESALISQVHHLIEAGQHLVVLDGISTWAQYRALRRAFPDSVHVVALLTTKHMRHHRLAKRDHNPITNQAAYELDIKELELMNYAGPIADADEFILNSTPIETLYLQLDQRLPAWRS